MHIYVCRHLRIIINFHVFVCVSVCAHAYVYVFMVELATELLLPMRHYALNDLVCAGRQEFDLRWTGSNSVCVTAFLGGL